METSDRSGSAIVPGDDRERRNTLREAMSQPLGFRPIGTVPGELVDISAGGAAITSLIAVPHGTLVQLSLLRNSVSINGTVRNLAQLDGGGYRLGLEFQTPQAGLPELLSKANQYQQ